ncbi:MAG: hypothetical protein II042_03190 [Erysipelotrichaceae bacterium]|nr:hypothetical protein [Erysipelotrichaceae bacterium]
MRYSFEEDAHLFQASGKIYDEEDQVVYRYQNSHMVEPRIDLFKYDVNIGHVISRFSLLHRSYEIFYGADLIGVLEVNSSLSSMQLSIPELGWHIEGGAFCEKFDILNEKEELIAIADKKGPVLSRQYGIEIYDEFNEEMIILLIVALNQYIKEKEAAAVA